MKQQSQFKPLFVRKTKDEEQGERKAGHKFWCYKCEAFRVHSVIGVGNGTPKLQSRCRSCGTSDTFVNAAGQWVPEALLGALDVFAEARIAKSTEKAWETAKMDGVEEPPKRDPKEMRKTRKSKARIAIGMLKPKNKEITTEMIDDGYTGSKEWQTLRGGLDLRTKRSRLKAWMTCRRYLLIVAPVVAALGLMLTSMILVRYYGYYLDFLRPMWSPWPSETVKYEGGTFVILALLAGYVRCRLARRKAGRESSDPDESDAAGYGDPRGWGDSHETEHDVLAGMEDF